MNDKLNIQETQRRIRKVGGYHLLLFLLPILSVLYYGWLKSAELNTRPDNPHRIAPLNQRGKILDRSGTPLVTVLEGERAYPAGECTGSLVGYELRGRNQTGLEAALQGEISPPLPAVTLTQALIQDREVSAGKRSQLQGPDIRLTIDLKIQQQLFQALSPFPGAIALADPQGDIIAAVSSPSFDPNKVRENWQALRSDPKSPFIERVGSGFYPVLRPDGSPLLTQQESKNHTWFSKDPFPNYPLASEAAWIEGRLFITPLMLLESAFQTVDRVPRQGLSLRQERKPASSQRSVPPSLQEPADSASESLRYWLLQGPPFRNSPSFLAVIGETSERYCFAIVVEVDSSQAQAQLVDKILPALELVGRTQQVSETGRGR